jgi:hypothetical protein
MAHTVTPLSILPDGSFALYADTESYRTMRVLATNSTAETFVVPTGAKYVLFGATGDFCARYNATTTGTAASFADVTDGSGCEINPTLRFLKDTCLSISVIGKLTSTAVSAAWYK